jgi:hypothetical protein
MVLQTGNQLPRGLLIRHCRWGGAFLVQLQINVLDTASNTNGFELRDASGNVLFSYWHQGGDNVDGHYSDASTVNGTASGFGYDFEKLDSFEFTLDSATTYTFTDITTSNSFSGTLSGAAISQVAFVRANGTSQPSNGQDFRFNTLIITSSNNPAPSFTIQPKNQWSLAGGTITLQALATSTQPLAYQWYFTNAPISGATANNLVLGNVGATNEGGYFVVASNSLVSVTSLVAMVSIVPFGYTNAYDVASNYSSFSGNLGFGFGSWVLSTGGGGDYISSDSPSLFGIWNSTADAESTAVRSFNSVLPTGGSFLVKLENSSLGLDSASNTNVFELQDTDGNVLFSYFHVGGDTTNGWFSDANGTGVAIGFAYDGGQVDQLAFTLVSPTAYIFRDLTTGTSFNGTLSGVPISQVTFVRANGPGTQSSGQDFKFNFPTILSPTGNPPVITMQPENNGGLVGSTIDLSGTADSGVGSVNYQWYLGNTAIEGATNAYLVLNNASLASSGGYYLVAANSFGSVTSVVSMVTVYVENNRLLAYDGFAYAGSFSSIDGVTQNGGLGWSGAWQNVEGINNLIQDGSLAGGTNVPAGYDSFSISNSYYNYDQSRAGRLLDCSTNGALAARGYLNSAGYIGAAGKTLYVSFLMQPSTTSSFYEFEIHRDNLNDPGRIAGVGNDTASTDVYLRTPGAPFADLGAGDTAVDFYVVRIDFLGGNDNVRVYRNPTSLTEPLMPTLALTNVGNMSFNGISFGAFGNNLAIDEMRLGATWSDALGMPGANGMMQPVRQGNSWNIRFTGNPAFSYRVQRATSLTGGWTDLGTVTPSESGIGTINDPNAPAGGAFYRTVTP